MNIPGQNLLRMALTMVARQGLTYYKFASRALNNLGQDVTTYQPGITIQGSWQPVPRNLYMQHGLDFQKDYYTFYTAHDLLDLDRDVTADQVAFEGQLFQVESANDWYALDGWKGVLCVHIGPDIEQKGIWGFGTVPATNDYQNFGHGNFLGTDEN